MAHICPEQCHRCPDIREALLKGKKERGEPLTVEEGEDVMPHCGGNGFYHTSENWEERCYCIKRVYKNTLEDRISVLEKELAELKKAR